MIFVDRSKVAVPEILLSGRAEDARSHITQMLATASKSHLEQLRFSFADQLWMVARPALNELLHNKCAYCESPALGGSFRHDIEHFRPKESAEDAHGNSEHLYYAWLAYDWDNLLLACPTCNRMRTSEDGIVGKGSRFPVTGSRAPIGSTVSQCRQSEQNTLIDPCFDKPSEHFTFDPNGVCTALTERGLLTIAVLGLNRSELLAERSKVVTEVTRVFRSDWHSPLVGLVEARAAYAGAARAQVNMECSSRGLVTPPWDELDEDGIVSAVTRLFTAERRATRVSPQPATSVVQLPKVTTPDRYAGRETLPEKAQRWLSRIEIADFKAIEEVAIDVPERPGGEGDSAPALMLLGENAAGKSSILEAVALALLGTREIARLNLDGKEYLRRNDAWEPLGKPAQIRLSFNGDDQPSTTLTIDERTGEFRGRDREQVVLLGYGPRRFFSNSRGRRRKGGGAARLQTLFDPTAIITNPSGWLMNCSEHDFNSAVRALRQLLLLPDEAFVARPKRGHRGGAEIMFELQGSATPLNRLSEGYRTVVATAVDVMREMLDFWPNLEKARGVVLIDELETHLHPRWKMRILQRLRTAMPGVQFIATTHDPLCLRGLYDGEVQVLRRGEGSRIEQVSDLPNVQGLTVEQLLTSEFFGLLSTEDPSVEADLIRYVALATKQGRSPDEEAELQQQRDRAQRRIRLGALPQTQLLYETANEFLVRERHLASGHRADLKRDTAEKMLDIWSSLKDDPAPA